MIYFVFQVGWRNDMMRHREHIVTCCLVTRLPDAPIRMCTCSYVHTCQDFHSPSRVLKQNQHPVLIDYKHSICSIRQRSFSCDLQRQMWNLLVLCFASLKKSWWNPTEKSEAKSQHLLHPTKLSIVDFTLNDVLVLRVLVLAEWVRCDSKITIWHLVFCCFFLRPASTT